MNPSSKLAALLALLLLCPPPSALVGGEDANATSSTCPEPPEPPVGTNLRLVENGGGDGAASYVCVDGHYFDEDKDAGPFVLHCLEGEGRWELRTWKRCVQASGEG